MRNFIINKVIKNSPLIAYLIIYSPLLIGLILFFTEPMLGGHFFNFPLAIYFFPFPFLLFEVLWLDAVYFAIRPKIDCETGLNDRKFIRLITFSKWIFLILTITGWCTELIALIDIQNLEMTIKIPLIILWSIAMLFMLFSYYSYYYGAKFIGKLIVVAEQQKPWTQINIYAIELNAPRESLPWAYRKTHRRIQSILNDK